MGDPRTRVRGLGGDRAPPAQLAGALVPPALYLLVVPRPPATPTAAIYWFRFNFSYVGAGLTGSAAIARGLRRTALIGGVGAGALRAGRSRRRAPPRPRCVRVIRRRLARRARQSMPRCRRPRWCWALLWLATSAVAVDGRRALLRALLSPGPARRCACWPRRAFAGCGARAGRRRAPLLVLCALPALFFFGLATVGRPLAAALDEREPRYDEVAARIAELTAADERIFVWGNSPQLYVLARRPMGARFSFCNYMTGESPGTPTETGAARTPTPTSCRPRWEMLFADLERRRPALFVDAAAAGWDGYGKYPLARYPRLRAYVDQQLPAGGGRGRASSCIGGCGRDRPRSPRRRPESRASGDRSARRRRRRRAARRT